MMESHDRSEKELLLIGTRHTDPHGARRLLDLLWKEKPLEVLVEVSPFGIAFRRRNGRRLRCLLGRRLRHLTGGAQASKDREPARPIFLQLGTPFEYRASLRYCRDSGAGLSCIDLSSQSRQWIQGHWGEMLDTANLKALLENPPVETASKDYGLACRLMAEKEESCITPYLRSWMDDPDSVIREAHLANQVAGAYERMKAGRIAYVGGWQHLLHPTDAGTLCDRLAHLSPRRILLSGC
jgi:hypothetical protein